MMRRDMRRCRRWRAKQAHRVCRVVVEQLLAVRQLPHILNEQASTCRSQGPQATVRQADHTSSRTHAARCSVFPAAHEAADRVFHGGRHGYIGVCGA